MMKFLRVYILYRLYFIVGLIVLGITFHSFKEAGLAWVCYILAAFSLALYFMIGTMRLVQEAITDSDPEKAMEYLNAIKFPRLLLKPIRSSYYMLQSNMALANNDLAKAEANIKSSMKTKSKLMGDTEGMAYFQMATIQLQKGNTKEARTNLLQAVKLGMPDKENMAAAYLQLSSIEIQRHQNKVGKEYFRRAKALKPKTEQLVSQISQMEKYIARIPG